MMRAIKVTHAGRAYNGAYDIEAGRLHVSSAYGSTSAKASKAPKEQAEKLFSKLLQERPA